MRKLFLSVLCAIGLFSFDNYANAQMLSNIEGMPPYKLGVTVGFNASNFSASKFDSKAGFNIGADLMLDASDLIENTFVRVNLLLQRKGSRFNLNKIRDSKDTLPLETKARVLYLEMPLAYGYAYRLNNDWALFGEMGPYFAFGLGGHYHTPAYGTPLFTDAPSYVPFFSSKFHSQKPGRFDAGWNIAVGGILWNQHQFKMGYEFGFINMNDSFQQNRNFMINYTYFLE